MVLVAVMVGLLLGSSDPEDPNYLNYLWGAGGVDVWVSDSTVYASVASIYQDALSIQNVSDPANPSHVSEIYGAGRPNYLDAPQKAPLYLVDGTKLVFIPAYADNALSIINVSNPSDPTFEGEIHKKGQRPYLEDAHDVKVGIVDSTEYAFVVAVRDNALTIIDVSAPSRPKRESEIYGAGSPNYLGTPSSIDLFIIGSTLYAFVTAINDDALVVIDVSDPGSPSKVADIRGAGSPNYLDAPHGVKIFQIGSTPYAFVVSAADAALTVFDVSTPSSPTHVGEIHGTGSPNYLSGAHCIDIATIGSKHYAFVVSYIDDALSIFDVTTPSSPTLESVVHGAGSPNYLDYAYGVSVAVIGSTPYAFIVARNDSALTIWKLELQ